MRGSSFPDYTGAGYNKAMRLPLIIMAAFGCYLFRPALALAQSPIEVITHTVEAAPGFIFTAPPPVIWWWLTVRAAWSLTGI